MIVLEGLVVKAGLSTGLWTRLTTGLWTRLSIGLWTRLSTGLLDWTLDWTMHWTMEWTLDSTMGWSVTVLPRQPSLAAWQGDIRDLYVGFGILHCSFGVNV